MSSGADDLSIGCYLPVKGGKGRVNQLFDKHADQDTFSRPVGLGTVDFPIVLHLSFLLK